MKKNRDLSRQAGFTLIEILVVIGIIAILATIVLIAINPARQFRQARDTQRVSNINAVLNGVGQYIADNKGSFPTGLTAASVPITNISNSGVDLCDSLVPTYLPALPVDPAAGISPVASSTCPTAWGDSLYNVSKSSDGRITISANGEEPAGADNISVTR